MPPPTDAEPPECVLASRGAAPTSAPPRSVGRELVPLALRRTAGRDDRHGPRHGRSAPTELLGIWPTLVDKTLVDPHVTVVRRGGLTCTCASQLRELCGYRAGDKGDIADVALFADDDDATR